MDKKGKKLPSGMKQPRPDLITVNKGGGIFVLFGLPFLLAGLLIMQSPWGFIPLDQEASESPVFLVLMGLVFAGVGAGFVFGRAGIIIDRTTNKVVKWQGLLVPMRRREYYLDLYGKVSLKREVRGGGNSQKTVYPVRLEPVEGGKPLEIMAPPLYHQARICAERIAAFLERPLSDWTSGREVVRAPDKLDLPLREQLRAGEKPVELPPEPGEMKTKVSRNEEGLVLEIPSPGIQKQHIIIFGFLAPAVLLFFLTVSGIMNDLAPGVAWDKWLPPVLFGLFAFGIIGFKRAGVRLGSPTVVVVSPDFIRVELPGLNKKKLVEIPGDELEELFVSTPELYQALNSAVQETGSQTGFPSAAWEGKTSGTPGSAARVPAFLRPFLRMLAPAGITARSDFESISFGQGLDPEELSYLHALMLKEIAGDS